MDRRFRLVILASLVFAALATPAFAEAAFQKLLPFLIDLSGWQGDKPQGMSMDSGDGAMTTASRVYHRGSDRIEIAVLVGPAAQGVLAPTAADMNMETTEGHMKTGTLAGFRVMKSYSENSKSGALMFALGEAQALAMNYNGPTEDEIVATAQKLDLKGIQAAAAAK